MPKKIDNEAIYERAVKAAKDAVKLYRDNFGEIPYCGFAWVVVPGNSSFGKWLLKNDKGRKGYPSGVHIWYSTWSSSQSMDLAEEGARAFIKSLALSGVNGAYMGSRPD